MTTTTILQLEQAASGTLQPGASRNCLLLAYGRPLILVLGLLILQGGCPSMQAMESVGLDLTRPTIYGPIGTAGRTTPSAEAAEADPAFVQFAPAPGGSPTPGLNPAAFESELARQFPACSDPPIGEAYQSEVLRLVNRERAARGLSALVRSTTLEQQAAQYACELIQFRFFDHVNPVTGSRLRDRAEQFGYVYQAIGENLAAGQPTPAQVMEDWMNSPGHRQNILNPDYTELGVAYRVGGRYTHYWVQEFGRPAPPSLTAGKSIVLQR